MNKDTMDSTLHYTPSEVVKNSTVQNMSEPMAPLGAKCLPHSLPLQTPKLPLTFDFYFLTLFVGMKCLKGNFGIFFSPSFLPLLHLQSYTMIPNVQKGP